MLKGNAQVTLRVYANTIFLFFFSFFGPHFPHQPPIVMVQAKVAEHPYIDATSSVIKHPKLTNQWPGVHANIADIMSEIINIFQNSPPKILAYTPPSMTAPVYTPPQPTPQPSNPMSASMTNLPPPPVQQQSALARSNSMGSKPVPPKAALVPIPEQFAALDEQKLDVLQALEKNPELLDNFVQHLDCVKSLQNLDIVKQMREETKKLSEANISKDAANQQKADLIKTKQGILNDLLQQHQETRKQYEAIAQRYGVGQMLAKLNEKIVQVEDETDTLSDKFVDSMGAVDDQQMKQFIQEFKEKRSLLYLRKAKKERFQKAYANSV